MDSMPIRSTLTTFCFIEVYLLFFYFLLWSSGIQALENLRLTYPSLVDVVASFHTLNLGNNNER